MAGLEILAGFLAALYDLPKPAKWAYPKKRRNITTTRVAVQPVAAQHVAESSRASKPWLEICQHLTGLRAVTMARGMHESSARGCPSASAVRMHKAPFCIISGMYSFAELPLNALSSYRPALLIKSRLGST